jgi:hypothetical protein
MLIDVACFDESKKNSLFITMLSFVSSIAARNHTQMSIEYDACMNERTRTPRGALNQLAARVVAAGYAVGSCSHHQSTECSIAGSHSHMLSTYNYST